MGFWAAMHIENERRAAAWDRADRLDQNAFDLLAIAGGISEGALRAQGNVTQPVIVAGPALKSASIAIESEQFIGVPGTASANKYAASRGFDCADRKAACTLLCDLRTIVVIEPHNRRCAFVNDCGKAATCEPLCIDRCLWRASVERGECAARDIDKMQGCGRRVVHIDACN